MKCTWLGFLLLGLGLAAWLTTAQGAVSGAGARSVLPAADERSAPSHLWVAPHSFDARLPVWIESGPNERQVETMIVGNDGLSASLEYTITVYPFHWRAGVVTWLEVTPTHGTIPPGGQVPIGVSFVPTESMPAGLYPATVYIESDSLSEPVTMPVPAVLEILDTVLDVAPSLLSAQLFAGQSLSLPVTLHNLASLTATFTAGVPALAPWLSSAPGSGPLPGGGQSTMWAVLDARGLAPGAYQGSLVLESSLLPGSALTVPVNLQVRLWSCYLPLAQALAAGEPPRSAHD